MDEEKAREILGESIREDGRLSDVGESYVFWKSRKDLGIEDAIHTVASEPITDKAVLDGDFSADELEAIAWWMRNKDRGRIADDLGATA